MEGLGGGGVRAGLGKAGVFERGMGQVASRRRGDLGTDVHVGLLVLRCLPCSRSM